MTGLRDAPPIWRKWSPRCGFSGLSFQHTNHYDLLLERVAADIRQILEMAVHVLGDGILVERDRQLLQCRSDACGGGIAVLEEGEDFVGSLFNITTFTR